MDILHWRILRMVHRQFIYLCGQQISGYWICLYSVSVHL